MNMQVSYAKNPIQNEARPHKIQVHLASNGSQRQTTLILIIKSHWRNTTPSHTHIRYFPLRISSGAFWTTRGAIWDVALTSAWFHTEKNKQRHQQNTERGRSPNNHSHHQHWWIWLAGNEVAAIKRANPRVLELGLRIRIIWCNASYPSAVPTLFTEPVKLETHTALNSSASFPIEPCLCQIHLKDHRKASSTPHRSWGL